MDERKMQVMEDFGDAALALMLEEQAEADGMALWEAYCRQNDPMPEPLDNACRKAVAKTLRKSHKHMLMGRALRCSAMLAACLVLVTTLIFSVEALRVPMLNFILTHGGASTVLRFQEREGWEETPLEEIRYILDTTVPDGFVLEIENSDSPSRLGRFYCSDDAGTLQIVIIPAMGSMSLDADEGQITEFTLAGHDAILVESDDLQAMWINKTQKLFYTVTASSMEKTDFLQFVEILAEKTTYSGAGLTNE